MKLRIYVSFAIMGLLLFSNDLIAQGVGINVSGTAADPSALLDISSTASPYMGVLIPRMSTASRSSIANPARGLLVFNTDCGVNEFFTGTCWIAMNQVLQTPDHITSSGTTDLCANESRTFTIPAVTGATKYEWIVPPGAFISSGQGTTSITVQLGKRSGQVCVRAGNLCESSSNSCVDVYVATIPVAPFANNDGPKCAGNNLTLSSTPVTNATYSWSGPNGFTSTLQNPVIANAQSSHTGSYSVVATVDGCPSAAAGTAIIINSIPPTPAASAGSGATETSIVAAWAVSASADAYYLDVSTSNTFTSFVPGFNNFNAGNVLTYTIGGLNCNTTYYYRVRASNACGASSSSSTISYSTSVCSFSCGGTFTDSRDGKVYSTVSIGSQCWMAQNLNVGTRINKSGNQTNNSTFEKYCYNDLDANCTTDGGLYQFDEAMQYSSTPGTQGICPGGWHLPTDAEWCTMETVLGANSPCASRSNYDYSYGVPGSVLVVGGSSGFKLLYAGTAGSANCWFDARGEGALFWTSSNSTGSSAWHRALYYGTNYNFLTRGNDSCLPKTNGGSIRCVKD